MIIINKCSYYCLLNRFFVTRNGFSHAGNREAEQSLIYFRRSAVLNRHPALHLETEVRR